MKALDVLPTEVDFNRLPLHIHAGDLDAFRTEWQIESLGMMINYKMNWTEWYAMREFVQNALDATESVILLYEDQQRISYIADNGPGIILRHMFLGEQKGETEEEIHCLRGRFGEGMKLGLLPLMRDGNKIIIRTVGTDYHFAVVERADPRGSFHQINMFSRPNQVSRGTVIAIHGSANCLKYRHFFAPMIAEDNPETILLTVKGGPEEYDDCKVRQVFDLPGKIFVRDIYVNHMDAIFGYNFWFDDTRKVLSTDRNEIKGGVWEISREFKYFLKASNEVFLYKLFQTLYTNQVFTNAATNQVFDITDSLEWKVLNRRFEERAVTSEFSREDASLIFSVIFDIVGGEFSWSRGIVEQKLLEHHRIVDLRDRLPDLRELLSRYGLVKDPKDLARATELTNETVIISPDDFRIAQLDGAEEDLAEALTLLEEELDCFREKLEAYGSDELSEVRITFYAGNFKGSEEKVLGYFERSTKTVYIHIKNLYNFRDLLRVFIHELAHAECSECNDITQEFEDAMQKIASNMIDLITEGKCDIDGIKRSCKTINQFDREFEQVIHEKVMTVSNPLGLIRPPHINPKDRDRLDETFFRISKGLYTEFSDVRPILWGYSPFAGYAGTYNLEWNCRGIQIKNMNRQQILEEDIKTLRKLDLPLPEKIDKLNQDDWITLINDEHRDELDSKYKLKEEDWSNPSACLRMIINHPSRWVKARNFEAFLRVSNVHRVRDNENIFYGVEWTGNELLDQLQLAAPNILQLQHPAQQIDNTDWYSYPLKEHLMEWADRFGWLQVLQMGLEAFSPKVRSIAISCLGYRNNFTNLIPLLFTETDSEPLLSLLRVLEKKLPLQDVKQLVVPAHAHISAVANAGKEGSYEGRQLYEAWPRFWERISRKA